MVTFTELAALNGKIEMTNAHLVKFVVTGGRRDELIKALSPMFEQVKQEPGTLQYMMHTCPTDPDAVWFYERYKDMDAFNIHQASDVHHAVVAEIMPMLDTDKSEIRFLDLLLSKG